MCSPTQEEIAELKRIVGFLNQELFKLKAIVVRMRSRVTTLTHICYDPASPESLDLDFGNYIV